MAIRLRLPQVQPSRKGLGTSRPVPGEVAIAALVLSVVAAVAAFLASLSAHGTLLDRTEKIVIVASTDGDR